MTAPFLPALGTQQTLLAYIGPGAGFAVLGSFLLLVTAMLLAITSFLSLPVRYLLRTVGIGKRRPPSDIKRIVVMGMDGLDPKITNRLLDDLPNLRQLRDQGTFTELRTTCPPISPVAWSSFMTGVNPGKHNIFDFLSRDPASYSLELSSCRIMHQGEKKASKPELINLRKSKPFWHILGERAILSTVLRVPMTFPPEDFEGLILAGMSTPDLRGTQGEFTFYASEDGDTIRAARRITVKVIDNSVKSFIPGPTTNKRESQIPFSIKILEDGTSATFSMQSNRIHLKQGVHSDWIQLTFRVDRKKISGICRAILISTQPSFKLYLTPIQINPASPVMPISYPSHYALYLAKLHGSFATLGLSEDTSALNEGIITDNQFLEQAYDIHLERETIFLDALNRTRTGLCLAVFDLTDRIQHMFHEHPNEAHSDTVAAAYRRVDALIGRTMSLLRPGDILMVLSDHGITRFERAVNLNGWLREEGLLTAIDPSSTADHLQNIDWSRTSAYAVGMTGIYLNLQGRERHGIVPLEQQDAVKARIMQGLMALKDGASDKPVVSRVYNASEIYSGPYAGNAPDLLVGFGEGYRISWESAVGRVDGPLFTNNEHPWGADHCVDRDIVPGVFFCNKRMTTNGNSPHITDLAPTILDLFGIEPPAYIDGSALKRVSDEE